MKTSDIPDEPILNYLYDRQGSWTCLWSLDFVPESGNVALAFPPGTLKKLFLTKMRSLHRRGLVGGCPCGCRGDFEITDKGLEVLGKPRLKPYTGY